MTNFLLFLILIVQIGQYFELMAIRKLNDFSREDDSVREMTENDQKAKDDVKKAKDRIPRA